MELKCERHGCKKKFLQDQNGPEACHYHPGKPIFHDLKKGWTCCNQIVYDWDEFQKIPTCAVGEHSTVKDTEKNQDQFYRNERNMPANNQVQENQPVIKSIDEFNREQDQKKAKEEVKEKKIFITKTGNYKCTNKGCLKEYSPESTDEECNFHTGNPIFHDCVKYWSCCKKETWDWDDFMKLPTCSVGKHSPKMV